MWRRSSVISILRQCKHLVNFHNPNISSFAPVFEFRTTNQLNKKYQQSLSLRQFCSDTLSSELTVSADVEGRIKEEEGKVVWDADVLYNMVIENAGVGKNLERVLERARVPLTTELVHETLIKLRFEDKIAFRFFMWVGEQECYEHEFHVYNEMIHILSSSKIKARRFKIVCEMLDYMKRNGKKSVPVEVVLSILKKYTEKYLTETKKCKRNRVRVVKQPEAKALNLLLEALCKCFLVETAESMFRKVKSKVRPDTDTFSILFFGWCRLRNPRRGMRVLQEMTDAGFSPDSFTYNTAIDTFCKAGMVNEASEIFEFMKEKGSILSCPTAKTYSIMILGLLKEDRTEECFRVVGDMIRSGCLPDVSTYKDLIEGMCVAGKVDEAYRFLEEMAKKGFPPDIVTYNCFLKVLCDNKMASQAMNLYRRIFEVGCFPSVHTFNMLIEMYFAMGDPEGAFEAWDEMDKKGCRRDINTYCVMIEGLFECDKTDDACSLIEDIVNKGMKLPNQKYERFLTHLSGIGNLRAIHNLSEHMKSFYNPSMARRFALSEKRKSLSLREL